MNGVRSTAGLTAGPLRRTSEVAPTRRAMLRPEGGLVVSITGGDEEVLELCGGVLAQAGEEVLVGG